MSTATETSDRILDVAQDLVQVHGFDGFSFADIAERVGIRKASIHHHFPTKSDLAVRLVERFRRQCRARLVASDESDPLVRIQAYVEIFRETLRSGRMCLCGILAAGVANLSREVRAAVLEALDDQERWLIAVVEEGQSLGVVRGDRESQILARNLMSGLEGALLLARIQDDSNRFETSVQCLMEGFRVRED